MTQRVNLNLKDDSVDLSIKVESLLKWASSVEAQLNLHRTFLQQVEFNLNHMNAIVESLCSVVTDSDLISKEELLELKNTVLSFQQQVRKKALEEAQQTPPQQESKIWTPDKKIIPPR